MKKKTEKIQWLTDWEWTTLVAAWRYYERRSTIASATFPADIVERFWGSGRYADTALTQIAHQFAKIDHGRDGGKFWSEDKTLNDCDKVAWCKFHAFCKAWIDGFSTVVLDGTTADGVHVYDEPPCFRCEYTGRWYSATEYIRNPRIEKYCADAFLRDVRAPKRVEAVK